MFHLLPKQPNSWIRIKTVFLAAVMTAGLSLAGCQSNATKDSVVTGANAGDGDEFLIIDCLLPGQVRKLGKNATYVTPRRPIKTTASECEIRGGDYVSYDRADFRTSLNVWLPLAMEGDPQAQNYVGEIYEKGLGVQPDYATAMAWYRKAADQGNARAKLSIGFLYEKGLGVKKDLAQALNWYRRASGLEEENLQFASSVEVSPQSDKEMRLLRQQAAREKSRSNRLQSQLQSAQGSLRSQQRSLARAESELEVLKGQYEDQRRSSPSTGTAVDDKQIAEIRSQLNSKEREVRQQREQISRLEGNLAEQQSQAVDERKASGEAKRRLESDLQAQVDENRQLSQDLNQANAGLQRSNRQLEVSRGRQEVDQRQLQAAQRSLEENGQTVLNREREVAGLRSDLEKKESQLGVQGATTARLREQADSYRRQLDELQKEIITERSSLKADVSGRERKIGDLSEKLSVTQQDLAESQASLARLNPALAREHTLLEQAQKDLEHARSDTRQKEAEVADLRASQQKNLAEIQRQREQIAQYESEAKGYKSELSELKSNQSAMEASLAAVQYPGPSIEILDPPLALTRGIPSVRLRSAAKQRLITGKVTAPAGLLSFTVNDTVAETDEFGTFKTAIAIDKEQTSVKMVAVDKAGQQATVEFLLIPKLRHIKSSEEFTADRGGSSRSARSFGSIDFGNYHALVIGNNQYKHFPSLRSAVQDARQAADILSNKYGFQTTTLIDATRYDMLSALNTLRERLTKKDNLLIYYAGHGELDRVNLRGHWLPVDAEPNNTANWISNTAVTDILNTTSAKHVLVVADSCYSGSLTRSSLARLDAEMSDEITARWLKVMAKTRSRTVLTSGGLQPVLDEGDGRHSVFANAFLRVLDQNDSILEAYKLYRGLAKEVQQSAAEFGVDQIPEYAPIRHGGHEAGEFFFIPQG